MASTPYLTQDKRDYITKYGLEEMISLAVNNMMRDEPSEPPNYLARHFAGLADNSIKIERMAAKQLYLDEKHPFLEIATTVLYKGQAYTFKYVHQALEEYEKSQDNLIDKHDQLGLTVFDLGRAVKAINQDLSAFIQGKDLSNLIDFDEKLLTYCKENELRFKNVVSTVSFAALHSVASLYNRSITGQLNFQLTGVEEADKPFPMPGLVFRLFAGGPFVSPKFRATSVGLVVHEECQMGWNELLQLARKVFVEVENVIAKGKGGKDLIKPTVDGSYICPVDTVVEAVKIVEDALKTAGVNEIFGLWVNYASHKYWNKELNKYEFENFKKGSDPEEVEEIILKLLLDKKIVKVIEDPFILDHKSSWHRLNLKLKEKNHSVLFASSKYYESIEEKKAFNKDVLESDFPPKTKNAAEMAAKMNQNRAHISFKTLKFSDFYTCTEFVKRISELKKIHANDNMTLVVSDTAQVLNDDLFLEICLPIGLNYFSLGSPLLQQRFLSYQKRQIHPREVKRPEAVEGGSPGTSGNLRSSPTIGKEAGKASKADVKKSTLNTGDKK